MYILSINKARDVIAYSDDMNDNVNLIAWIMLYLAHVDHLKNMIYIVFCYTPAVKTDGKDLCGNVTSSKRN